MELQKDEMVKKSELNTVEIFDFYNIKLNDSDFDRIRKFLLEHLGIKFDINKRVMATSRLLKRLKKKEYTNFTDYLNFTFSEEGKRNGELQALIDELTTHKTDFFRENDHFKFLKEVVLPDLTSKTKSEFLIWSAGCSTGEEPYSMALILNEYAETNNGLNFKVFASDVSQSSLLSASRAIYSLDQAIEIPDNLLRKYCMKSKNNERKEVRICGAIRKKVQFFRLNLMDEFSFKESELDVVFCRNTLIYFDEKSKKEVVEKLISKLKIGGYLFVGMSETVSLYSSRIKQVSPSVYIKIE